MKATVKRETKDNSDQLYNKFVDDMTSINSNKVNFIGIKKRESIRKSVLQSMRKFYRVQNLSNANDPELALTKIEIKHLLEGKQKATPPGYGSLNLFDNPQLKKPRKKITAKVVEMEMEEINNRFKKNKRLKPQTKESSTVVPVRFTFTQKKDQVGYGSDE